MTISAIRDKVIADADVTALLSIAMNTTSRHRKAAALALAGAVRRAVAVHDRIEAVAAEAGARYGAGAAAEVRALAAELRLN